MAVPTTIKSAAIVVKIGDGGSSEIFAAPCGFRERSFSRSKELNSDVIPDCDTPDAPSWTVRDVASQSWSITGEGLLATESVPTWDAMFASNTSRNVRVEITYPAPVGLVVYAGKAHLESLEVGASIGTRSTLSVSLQGDGELVRTPAI